VPQTTQKGSGSSPSPRGAALVYFAKAPRPGQVKTRLCPPLTHAEAAGLYRGFLEDILVPIAGVRSLVYGWPEAGLDELADLLPEDLELRPQRGVNLWERMLKCQEELFAEGHDRVLIRNTDSPDLPPERIAEALAACAAGKVVLGPDLGGGYYLVAVCEVHRGLFEGLDEGEHSVLLMTVGNAKALGLELQLLPEHADVDRYEDLQALWLRRVRSD